MWRWAAYVSGGKKGPAKLVHCASAAQEMSHYLGQLFHTQAPHKGFCQWLWGVQGHRGDRAVNSWSKRSGNRAGLLSRTGKLEVLGTVMHCAGAAQEMAHSCANMYYSGDAASRAPKQRCASP